MRVFKMSRLPLPVTAVDSISDLTSIVQQAGIQMITAKTVRFNIEIAADLAAAITGAAKANNVAAEDIVSDCVRQQFETALRHRVLIVVRHPQPLGDGDKMDPHTHVTVSIDPDKVPGMKKYLEKILGKGRFWISDHRDGRAFMGTAAYPVWKLAKFSLNDLSDDNLAEFFSQSARLRFVEAVGELRASKKGVVEESVDSHAPSGDWEFYDDDFSPVPAAPEGAPGASAAAVESEMFLRRVPQQQTEMDLTRRDRLPPEVVDETLQIRLPLTDDEIDLQSALLAIDAGETVDWSVSRNLIGAGFVQATTTRLIVTDEGRKFLAQLARPAASQSSASFEDADVLSSAAIESDARPKIGPGEMAPRELFDVAPRGGDHSLAAGSAATITLCPRRCGS
jgi:hypothetical protein